MAGLGEPQRHVVVFDCNVYLDVAQLLGPPVTIDGFHQAAASLARANLGQPHPACDSLRALALCESGRFAGNETLEVWTNAHIEGVVLDKAIQSVTPDPRSGYRGLGWSREHAFSIVEVLIEHLTEQSNGGTLGATFPDGNPPLDHEDGMVFGACRTLSGDDPVCNVYCVTRDRGFIQAYKDGRLGGHTVVMQPHTFVQLVRKARNQHSGRHMPRPR